MLKTQLIAGRNGKELHSYDGYDGDPVIVTTTHGAHHGQFNSETSVAAGTTVIVAVRSLDAIVVTDLIVATDKAAGTTFSINITDDVATETLAAASIADAPVSFALSVSGRMQTWRGTRIELVTVGAVAHNVTVTVGYYRIPWDKAMAYGEWDALR